MRDCNRCQCRNCRDMEYCEKKPPCDVCERYGSGAAVPTWADPEICENFRPDEECFMRLIGGEQKKDGYRYGIIQVIREPSDLIPQCSPKKGGIYFAMLHDKETKFATKQSDFCVVNINGMRTTLRQTKAGENEYVVLREFTERGGEFVELWARR